MRKAEQYFPFLAAAVFALVLACILLLSGTFDRGIPILPDEQAANTVDPDSGKININTASSDELCILPGIGDALAVQIIAFREKNGGFSTIYEITNVTGIGNECFLQIRNYITVGG